MPNLSIEFQNFVFRIEKTFSLFPAAQLLGSETLSQTVTHGEHGRESVEGGHVLVRDGKSHTGRFVRSQQRGVFLQKEWSHFYDSIPI